MLPSKIYAVAHLASEFKNPERDFPRALMIGLLLAVTGRLLCVLLLAMVGWKSLYALIMLAGLWLFLPKRKTPENGITT
ncbi:hypothetical protein EYW98_08925 [Escherichia coli]|nr:hypothetical protein [Escherichia coli]EGO8377034.1 hypothetical protein [Escherichia coli]